MAHMILTILTILFVVLLRKHDDYDLWYLKQKLRCFFRIHFKHMIYRTQMTHILEDWTHKMEGQLPQ